MDNEMMYKLFLNSIHKMSDQELDEALKKSKGFLKESDYLKLVELIQIERGKKS